MEWPAQSSDLSPDSRQTVSSVPVRWSLRHFQSDGRFISSSQTVGELATVEFVTVGEGLAALQRLSALQLLTAPHSYPLVVAPGGS